MCSGRHRHPGNCRSNHYSASIMKKTILALLSIILIVGCNKQNNQPAPAPVTQATPTPTPLTPLEQSLVGKWVLDSSITYYNGVRSQLTVHNDSTNCFLLLRTTERTLGDPTLWKLANHALYCSPVEIWWRTTSGKLDVGGTLYIIMNVTTNILSIQLGSVSSGGGWATRFHFHK